MVRLVYVPTTEMAADMMTKALPHNKLHTKCIKPAVC